MALNVFNRLAALYAANPKSRRYPGRASITRDVAWVECRTSGAVATEFRLVHYDTTLVEAHPTMFFLSGYPSTTSQRRLRNHAGICTSLSGGQMTYGRVVLGYTPVPFDFGLIPIGDDFNVFADPWPQDKLDALRALLDDPAMPMAAGGQTVRECAALIPLMPGFSRRLLRTLADERPDMRMAYAPELLMKWAILGPMGTKRPTTFRAGDLKAMAARYGVTLTNQDF